jgi:hypothetical protein
MPKGNYIINLQKTVENLSAQKQEARDVISDLREYLQSGKFNCGDELDGYVNVQDVLNRLRGL